MIRPPAKLRDALLDAMLPSPGPGLPSAGALPLDGFWLRFHASAPIHLELGFFASVVVLGSVAPRALGFGGSLVDLDDDARDRFLERAAGLLPLAPLVEVAKVVTGLAYFSVPSVEDAFRRPA